MGTRTGQGRASATQRHPVLAFLGLLVTFSILIEALAAGIHGGWAVWGESILWYRLSCVLNNVVIGAGAYFFVRWFRGPLWWLRPHGYRWSIFAGVAALQSLFLVVLAGQFQQLYPDVPPPLSTHWLPAVVRVLAPLLCLYWVRLQFAFSSTPVPSRPNRPSYPWSRPN